MVEMVLFISHAKPKHPQEPCVFIHSRIGLQATERLQAVMVDFSWQQSPNSLKYHTQEASEI